VSEKSILEAIRVLYEKEKLVIEGAGAASTAVLLERKSELKGKRVVAVVSGGNISEEEVVSLLS
jgi:threonine dehydratase